LDRFAEKRESCEITEVKGCIPIGLPWKTSVTTSSTVFTNRSQAVRLPKAVAFPEGVREVDILKIGPAASSPKGKRWDDLFRSGQRASKDFIPNVSSRQPRREQGRVSESITRHSAAQHDEKVWCMTPLANPERGLRLRLQPALRAKTNSD
jgi:antitoxin VapB